MKCCLPDCNVVFRHPDDTDCPTTEGSCSYLIDAGWKPVELVVRAKYPSRVKLYVCGGWLCPSHAKR